MLDPFVIVLREGFEAFLIVAIIFTYLRKTKQNSLAPAVYSAIAVAIAASAALGYQISQATEGVNQAFWEGVLGLVAVVLVASLIFHMRRVAPKLKQTMHQKLDEATSGRPKWVAFLGVFIFTVLMITREGMETALMLLRIQDQFQLLAGALLGLAGATFMALAWARYGHLVNMKLFFQVTNVYLVLFLMQVAIYTFHEFAEAHVFGQYSDAFHAATEIISPDGKYGQWFSTGIVGLCVVWLVVAFLIERSRTRERLSVPTDAVGQAR